MVQTWLLFLPPLLTLSLAITTRRIKTSLIIGIITAASIATNFSLQETVALALQRFWQTTELATLASWKAFTANYTLFMCFFLIILGIMVALINQTGATSAYTTFVRNHVRNARNTQIATLILSTCLCIDDYLSSLTTGVVMRPLTDHYRIPRVKLAFLIDAMAAAICAITPLSVWSAAIIGPLRQTGITDVLATNVTITTDTFWVFLQSIPFTFYSLFIVAAAWFIVLRRISFGAMHRHEIIAQQTGNLFGGNKLREAANLEIITNTQSTLFDFLFPMASLVFFVFTNLLYSGNYYLFGGGNSFVKALQNAEISTALFNGGSIALLLSILFALMRRQLRCNQLANIVWQGTKLMLPSIAILILVWTFGTLLRSDLQTGQHIAHMITGTIHPALLPGIFFLMALLTSFTTGSSWGTIAIMIPIGIPMLLALLEINAPIPAVQIPILFPLIGAIISGAIAGDHMSPLSDTTVMSSTSAGANHIDHVRTQFSYAIPVIIGCAISFFLVGLLIPYGRLFSFSVATGIGLGISFAILSIRNYLRK